MTKRIYWQKPFHVVTEKDKGMIPDSIVSYEKTPILFNTVKLTSEEAKIKGYIAELRPIEYGHRLMINLWIVVLHFDWKTVLKK